MISQEEFDELKKRVGELESSLDEMALCREFLEDELEERHVRSVARKLAVPVIVVIGFLATIIVTAAKVGLFSGGQREDKIAEGNYSSWTAVKLLTGSPDNIWQIAYIQFRDIKHDDYANVHRHAVVGLMPTTVTLPMTGIEVCEYHPQFKTLLTSYRPGAYINFELADKYDSYHGFDDPSELVRWKKSPYPKSVIENDRCHSHYCPVDSPAKIAGKKRRPARGDGAVITLRTA